jgi:asparagine synthase (glutamine-hydrolysing)
MTTLLPSYLLSSQGDRVALAHGIESRFPFLDHRLFELAASLPTSSKLCGLREKEILRRFARDVVPPSVRDRSKQPYRAPDIPAFFAPEQPEYLADVLDATAVRRAGMFDPHAVGGLVARCRSGRAASVRESQALVGILSAQLWHDQFFVQPTYTADTRRPDVALDDDTNDHPLNPVLVEAQ